MPQRSSPSTGERHEAKMDPNLHQKQGINHLNRVLSYAELVRDGDRAQVHLTPEDWQVVADTLFQMETPREMLPEAIAEYSLTGGNRIIELVTDQLTIDLEIM
jgi:hypothetical protein